MGNKPILFLFFAGIIRFIKVYKKGLETYMLEKFGKHNWITLLIFGIAGQIAWSVENMYFNLFVYDVIDKNLDAVTLMVQLSGIMATVATLLAGALSDGLGNRRKFISLGYLIWGVSVALFGCISPELVGQIFAIEGVRAVAAALALAIVADCVMTLFGSTANDAAFNAWVTDNTHPAYRGSVEGVVAILPLFSMLVVVGGFGMLVGMVGYTAVFVALGAIISVCGAFGLFFVRDSDDLSPKKGGILAIVYGFRPSVVRENALLYIVFVIVGIYGIACQVFMPYLIIYMRESLGFSTLEYSAVFAVAIIVGGVINIFLGKMSDRTEKSRLLYVAILIFSVGLFTMYMARDMIHVANLIFFGLSGFAMITGYIFVAQLTGSMMLDYTPKHDVGKMQGVRMVFAVLIPMIVGPMIGNAINRAHGLVLENPGADAMTTSYIPAAEIFLVASGISLFSLVFVYILKKLIAKRGEPCEH